ncbi:hypothetical protein ACFQ2M_29380 [Kitasatospora saccharophila]|uniref:hypothetical protein n=1 Tax=Kitasatospora saccharophila TaxID=407973 RepID=UPI0031E0003C
MILFIGIVAPTDTPNQRAACSDSTTCPASRGQSPCANCAKRCGSSTATGDNGSPEATTPAEAPTVDPAGNCTANGFETCSTSSIRADTPGSARCNAARTRASAFSSAPSAYRPDTETDNRGSSSNRFRIPSVTELAVSAVNAVNTATANNTVTAAAPSTTPCCPARRTPAGEPRPSARMSPEVLPSSLDGLDQS